MSVREKLDPLLEQVNAEEPSCQMCGACCQGGTQMWLTRQEAVLLKTNGTEIVTEFELGGLFGLNPVAETLYEMKGACGFLESNSGGTFSCGIYGKPERPRTCVKTQAASQPCRDMQVERVHKIVELDLMRILSNMVPLPTEIELAPVPS